MVQNRWNILGDPYGPAMWSRIGASLDEKNKIKDSWKGARCGRTPIALAPIRMLGRYCSTIFLETPFEDEVERVFGGDIETLILHNIPNNETGMPVTKQGTFRVSALSQPGNPLSAISFARRILYGYFAEKRDKTPWISVKCIWRTKGHCGYLESERNNALQQNTGDNLRYWAKCLHEI